MLNTTAKEAPQDVRMGAERTFNILCFSSQVTITRANYKVWNLAILVVTPYYTVKYMVCLLS